MNNPHFLIRKVQEVYLIYPKTKKKIKKMKLKKKKIKTKLKNLYLEIKKKMTLKKVNKIQDFLQIFKITKK